MKRKDKQITKFLHDPLPDPEIPADDAWADMNDMLDTATGRGTNGSKWPAQVWKSLGTLKRFLIVAFTLVTISAGVAWVVFKTKTADRQTAPARISAESRNAEGTVTKLDSLTGRMETGTNRNNAGNPAKAAHPLTEKMETGADRDNANRTTKGSGAVTERTKTSTARGNAIGSVSTAGVANDRTKTGTKSSKSIDNDIQTAQTQTSSHTRTRNAQATVMHKRDVQARRPSGDDYAENALPKDRSQSGNTGNGRQPTESSLLNQTNTTSSVSHENRTAPTAANSMLNSLESLSGRFGGAGNDLSKYIRKPEETVAQPAPKTRKSIFTDVHFGPEWNIGRSIVSPNYMFTNADSVKRPLRLAIPGVFVSKSWNRHSVTFIFNPLHSYFGNKERVAQRLDTLRSSDSLYVVNRHYTNFVKAFGMNFSLQYQYRAFSLISLVGGVSYAKYSSALLFREIEYPTGAIAMQEHLAAKGQDTLKSYIRPQQWNIRAGILFHSPDVFNNRLQFAWMTVFPLSNLSQKGFKSVKTPNMQLSIRFLIK
ncbi:hypothetical protein SAMN05216327_103273 [Dyadobacter sp. SG02]|uniref:hypothetical protein n=1 Tax=Dyadobacter sp. SG02 TaxID=1855291 RepID=UPI0008AB8614|nr:hypothetical protein [Dyadobacter sp. SG02]SEI69154.1 hypothetical protein SAMN05216327_103273 [Dyadobacter sp. SG02]